jgi:Fe-Mn family superoxide dismutase
MTIELPTLPFGYDALEPHISRATMETHHGKHHKAYVDKTNALIAGTPLENAPLEEIVRSAAGSKKARALFNNSAQAWNHGFFWKSLRPDGGEPQGEVRAAIERSFKSFDRFADTFAKTAGSQFGSGWTWLVKDGEKVKVVATSNADTPIVRGKTPLLVLDVWEHAYYLDYRNRRADYVQAFLRSLANWEFAESNLRGHDAMKLAAE